jgi:hypothetical protein
MRSAVRSALLRTHWMAGREVCVASRIEQVEASLASGASAGSSWQGQSGQGQFDNEGDQ